MISLSLRCLRTRERLLVTSISLLAIGLTGCKTQGAVPLTSSSVPPVLLFDGTGASANDVAAIEAILVDNQLQYSTANSSQLGDMSASRLRTYRLLIVPGGDFVAIANGLTTQTTAKLRDAVQHGLNYLGICAGGLFAGHSIDNGLNLTSGVRFGFYSAEDRGTRKAAVPISSAGAPTLDQYWEDGPQFTGWGAVVGRYPDGTPAIVEGTSGDGWVILSGVHPEAPANWRHGMTFTTPVSVDHAYAATLMRAALNRTRLPHF